MNSECVLHTPGPQKPGDTHYSLFTYLMIYLFLNFLFFIFICYYLFQAIIIAQTIQPPSPTAKTPPSSPLYGDGTNSRPKTSAQKSL